MCSDITSLYHTRRAYAALWLSFSCWPINRRYLRCKRELQSSGKMYLSITSLLSLITLGCLAPCCIPQAEAMKNAPSCPSIVGLPGRDGRDGQPGRDGRDGLPGPAVCNCQQFKQEIIEEVRRELFSSFPTSTTQPPTPSTSTASYNPTTTTAQPTSTPAVQLTCTYGLGASGNPATSCMEIYTCNPTALSGLYWIRGISVPVYTVR